MTKQVAKFPAIDTIKLFFIALLLSPFFWWFIVHANEFSLASRSLGPDIGKKLSTLSQPDGLDKYEDMRFSVQTATGNEVLGRLYFNKATVYQDEVFSYLTNFSPRIYFQAGDGTQLSPGTVEPIPILMFYVWLVGVSIIAKEKNWRVLVATLIAGVPAYISGQKTFLYLFPVALIYLYISVKGFQTLAYKKTVGIVLVLYSIVVLSRMI